MILPCPLRDESSDVQLLDFSADRKAPSIPQAKSLENLEIITSSSLNATASGKGQEKSNPKEFFKILNECFPKLVKPVELARSKNSKSRRSKSKLAVVKVGAYDCSVAKSLADLRRVDKDKLRVPEGIDSLLAKHYGKGYGFVICQFDPAAKIEPHPMGYVHDTLADSKLFVPCRHEHGDGDTAKAHFDHNIFSLNTRKEEAGPSPAEQYSEFKAKVKGEEEFKSYTVFPPKEESVMLKALGAVAPLKAHLPQKVNCLRKLELKGNLQNRDYIFATSGSEEA